jgi:hypothetical protein
LTPINTEDIAFRQLLFAGPKVGMFIQTGLPSPVVETTGYNIEPCLTALWFYLPPIHECLFDEFKRISPKFAWIYICGARIATPALHSLTLKYIKKPLKTA